MWHRPQRSTTTRVPSGDIRGLRYPARSPVCRSVFPAVEPRQHRVRASRAPPGSVREHAVGRHREPRRPVSRVRAHLFDDLHGISRQHSPLGIELLRHQRRPSCEEQAIGRRERGLDGRADEACPFLRVERREVNRVMFRHAAARQKKEVPPVGEEDGMPVPRLLARAVQLGHLNHVAARRPRLERSVPSLRRENDDVVGGSTIRRARGATSAIGWGGAPKISIFFSLPAEKNATKRSSGDQNGKTGYTGARQRLAAGRAMLCSQSDEVGPLPAVATRCVPRGDSANCCAPSAAGASISNAISGVPVQIAARRERRCGEADREQRGDAPRDACIAKQALSTAAICGTRDAGFGLRRQPFEREREIVGRLKARARTFLEAPIDDARERGRNVALRRRQVGRIFLEDRRHRVDRRLAVERALCPTASRRESRRTRRDPRDDRRLVPRTCSGAM